MLFLIVCLNFNFSSYLCTSFVAKPKLILVVIVRRALSRQHEHENPNREFQKQMITNMSNDTITIIHMVGSTENASQGMQGDFWQLVCKICSVHSAIVVVALLLAFVLWYRHRRLVQRFVSPRLLLTTSFFVFIFGTIIYTIGSLQSESMGFCDAIYTIPSAIISSLCMFFYQDDISELTDIVKSNSTYMACYSLAHFLAAIIMAFMILQLLGMRIIYWKKIKDCSKHAEKLYVFWGINTQSLSLAKSIHEECKTNDIVLVNTIDDDLDVNSVHRLLDIIKLKGNIDEKICDIDAILVNCYEDISDSSVCKGITLDGMIGRGAKLKYLAKAVRHSSELHIFFLSNDEDRNINSAYNVMKIVEGESSNGIRQRKTHVYCHARHSGKTQNLDFYNIVKFDAEPTVHVIDSSALAVATLKNSIDDCPVSFVNVDEATATINSPFRSMIIGFGETGMETLKFLYEFGAFVDNKGRKTPFHCTIIDEKASQLSGDFYVECPAMKGRADIMSRGNTIEKEIRFEECTIGSERYWETVKHEIEDGVNYIMLSVNDDNAGFNAAVKICRKAVGWRDEHCRKLSVYVRCANQENYEQLNNIAQDTRNRYDSITLNVFGNIDDIFNYRTIVDDIVLERARKYNWKYAGHELDIDACWIENLKLNRTKEEPNICNIEDSIRRRDQNFSNVLHSATKMYILEKTGKSKVYWDGKLERKPQTPYYLNLSDGDKRILTNLARLEHERWIAASLLQGWQPTDNSTDEKDEIQKKHNDIRPWNELRSAGADRLKVQGYDCDVVDTTIALWNTKYM